MPRLLHPLDRQCHWSDNATGQSSNNGETLLHSHVRAGARSTHCTHGRGMMATQFNNFFCYLSPSVNDCVWAESIWPSITLERCTEYTECWDATWCQKASLICNRILVCSCIPLNCNQYEMRTWAVTINYVYILHIITNYFLYIS